MLMSLRLPTLSFVYDRKKRATANRPASVELRVSYNYKQKYLSTGIRLLPKEWRKDSITNRPDAVQLNKILDSIRTKVAHILETMVEEDNIDLNEIAPRLERTSKEGKTFIEFCEERSEIRKYGRAKDTQQRYDRFMRYFKKWGKIRYFSDVTEHNIMLMDENLREKKMKNYSKWQNYHRFLNSYILDAINSGFLKKNPYKWIHIEKDKDSKTLQNFLSLDEIHQIETAKMPTPCLERVRDVFIFQTYTALAYKDLSNFDLNKGKERPDGHILYTSKRGKNGQEFTFIILEPAMRILKKYNGKLPLISNIKYNMYLKMVAQDAGIDKPITTHWARHTGATILLNAGIDMETVAKILGHSSTTITRKIYAKLLDDTIAEKMIQAEAKLK